MQTNTDIRRCLIELDVDGIIQLWPQVRPGWPVPSTREDALIALHLARTVAASIPLRLRAYSHRWLIDNGYPSQLPDDLKPRAERLYPRPSGGVGISVNSKYPVVKTAIHDAMRDAVLEAYADGVNDPLVIRARMQEARQRERRGLGL
jgi:hypothetical protein